MHTWLIISNGSRTTVCSGEQKLLLFFFFFFFFSCKQFPPCLSLVAQMVKNLPAMWETWDQSLGQEDPMEKRMATHSSILAWRIPWTKVQSTGSQSARHHWTINIFFRKIKQRCRYECRGGYVYTYNIAGVHKNISHRNNVSGNAKWCSRYAN